MLFEVELMDFIGLAFLVTTSLAASLPCGTYYHQSLRPLIHPLVNLTHRDGQLMDSNEINMKLLESFAQNTNIRRFAEDFYINRAKWPSGITEICAGCTDNRHSDS